MDVVLDNLGALAEGAWVTVQLALISYALAFAVGALVAAARVSPVPPLRVAGTLYVEAFRNVPLTVLFVLFFFGFPKLGVAYSPFVSAIIVLTVYHGTFLAETIRAGINTVAAGQADAARAVGLTYAQTLRLVVLPQALRSVVGPLGTLFVALTKNTSVAYVISTPELLRVTDDLGVQTAQNLPPLLGAGVAYLILTLPAGLAFEWVERRVEVRR